jgi:hypothetical protein
LPLGPPTAGDRFELDGEELIACKPGSSGAMTHEPDQGGDQREHRSRALGTTRGCVDGHFRILDLR